MDIIQLDHTLFHLLNGQWHNTVFDALIPFLRSKYTWIPLYIFVASFLLINWKMRGVVTLLFAIAMVGVADTTSSKIIKPTVERIRPCNDFSLPFEVRQLVKCGGGYSFTSSHATNHFAIATFMVIILGVYHKKWLAFAWFAWAATIAYGQIYVGVHYPLDVIFGALLGVFVGLFFGHILKISIHKNEIK